MKQFLQIHNTDCNKRRIFRRILLKKFSMSQRFFLLRTRNAPKAQQVKASGLALKKWGNSYI